MINKIKLFIKKVFIVLKGVIAKVKSLKVYAKIVELLQEKIPVWICVLAFLFGNKILSVAFEFAKNMIVSIFHIIF